jgi:hypothetical protein
LLKATRLGTLSVVSRLVTLSVGHKPVVEGRGKLLALALVACMSTVAYAAMPSVADLDAQSRAAGNRKDVAMTVGERVFATTWPAQVLQVEANQMGDHLVLGLHVSGVKFHDALTRAAFEREVRALVGETFAAAPKAEEVDVWVTVPISVGKGVVVSGDLAKPTTRTVYTLSALRGALDTSNTFIDEDWARVAFKKS